MKQVHPHSIKSEFAVNNYPFAHTELVLKTTCVCLRVCVCECLVGRLSSGLNPWPEGVLYDRWSVFYVTGSLFCMTGGLSSM